MCKLCIGSGGALGEVNVVKGFDICLFFCRTGLFNLSSFGLSANSDGEMKLEFWLLFINHWLLAVFVKDGGVGVSRCFPLNNP